MHGGGGCVVGGTCVAGETCMGGGMCGRGYAWQGWGACLAGVGACMAGGMHGRRGHVWWGVCMAGGLRGRSDGHCSRQYVSYWNAFLFYYQIRKVTVIYICLTSLTRAKWNFPLNFCTMRKLSDLYSGIFQNY